MLGLTADLAGFYALAAPTDDWRRWSSGFVPRILIRFKIAPQESKCAFEPGNSDQLLGCQTAELGATADAQHVVLAHSGEARLC
jgi:hypothetical protein